MICLFFSSLRICAGLSIFVAFGPILFCFGLWYIPRCLALASVVEFASQTLTHLLMSPRGPFEVFSL